MSSHHAPILGPTHTGMRVDYQGLLGQSRRALGRSEPMLAEMLRQFQTHIKELGRRYYRGEAVSIDEFLQLYCVERDVREALAKAAPQPAQPQQEPDEVTVWKARAMQAEAVIEKFMAQPAQQEPVAVDIQKAVDRFLGWKLPEDFCPDAGISFEREYSTKWGMPSGTNLFHAGQAKQMLEYVLQDTPSPAQRKPLTDQQTALANDAADQIMEQAQVFASAWSLVGGRFDSGNAMEGAEQAESELRTMVESLAREAAHSIGDKK